MNELLVRLNIFKANNLPRSEFIVTLLHEIHEISFVVKILSLSWSLSCCRLVPSCFVIFDLEPSSLSFDFVFMSDIFKSFSFSLDCFCHLAILCLDQHAHTSHLFESLLTISLDRLDILKEYLFEHEHVVMNQTSAGMRHLHLHLYMNPEIKQLAIKRVDEYGFIQRISLTGFPAQSVGSSNTDVLDLPCLLVLITGTSQSRQHGWRVCIDYRKLNEATRKDHFPLPFMDQMLERLAGNQFYCFLDGFSGYFQIPIDPKDQEKTTFTCPYGTFAYRRMPFGLCNAPGTFQRCMMAIFHDMIEKTMEVFMDDFSVFGDSFSTCLSHLDKMLKRCEDTNLVLNWEKSHFMVKEGIVLGHKISKSGIEVDRAKVDVIAKLPHPTTVKGVRSFLGHAGFYRRFIQDFSKISRPMTHLLEKETPFFFSKECIESFNTLKRKLTEAPILIAPDWDLPFELMCDASDFAIGAVLGQRKNKHFQPIHYASKTMTEAQAHYTTTEKELLAVVYAFEKFRSYLVLSKSIVYTDHSAIKYLFAKSSKNSMLLSETKKEQRIWPPIIFPDLRTLIKINSRTKKSRKHLTSKLWDRLLFMSILPHGLQISQITMPGIS
ncbi:reverse transcriptase domain-containing protein, partial [Tanacetum coccineum]